MVCAHCAIVHQAPTRSAPDASPVPPCQRVNFGGQLFSAEVWDRRAGRKNGFLVINGRPSLESVSFLTEDQALS